MAEAGIRRAHEPPDHSDRHQSQGGHHGDVPGEERRGLTGVGSGPEGTETLVRPAERGLRGPRIVRHEFDQALTDPNPELRHHVLRFRIVTDQVEE